MRRGPTRLPRRSLSPRLPSQALALLLLVLLGAGAPQVALAGGRAPRVDRSSPSSSSAAPPSSSAAAAATRTGAGARGKRAAAGRTGRTGRTGRATAAGQAGSPARSLGATRRGRPGRAGQPARALSATRPAATLRLAGRRAAASRLALRARPAAPQRAAWTGRSAALAESVVAAVRRRGLSGDAAIQAAVDQLAREATRRGLELSVSVGDLATGRAVAGRNARTAMNPASGSKVASALFGLATLGPRHRFRTAFSTDRRGNLFVKGGFDPSLTGADLDRIARQLADRGVTRVRGDLVLDAGRPAAEMRPAGYEQFGAEQYGYLAAPSSLAVDKNTFEATLRPGARPGDRAPLHGGGGSPRLVSEVVTTRSGPSKIQVDVRGGPAGPVVVVTGTISQEQGPRQLVMKSPDPTAQFADRLTAALRRAGIRVDGAVRTGATPRGARTRHVHRSAPLRDILPTSFRTSNNFDHEMIALAATARRTGRAAVAPGDAARAIGRFLREQVGIEGATIGNASGLGGANRLSGDQLVALLQHAQRTPLGPELQRAFARPGRAGTLEGRLVGTAAERRLAAKTGTDGAATSLTGTVSTASGRRLGFSFIVRGSAADRTPSVEWIDAAAAALSAL